MHIFFLAFFDKSFYFFICNLECMITLTFFVTFAFLLLIFYNILLTFILCIIDSKLSQWKFIIVIIFLTQKSFNFNIFLLFLNIILNTINFLNFCIFIMFLHAVSMIATLSSHINIIVLFAFIFCIRFIFWIFFIYVINFIFLLSFYFNNALITRATNVKNVILKFSAATFA